MYIMFVDESGTPPHPNKDHPKYFIMAGVIIKADQWATVRDAVNGMKIRRKYRGEFKWRYFAPGNTDEKNPMRKLDTDERNAIREELYKIISNCGCITSIASICCNEAAYEMASITCADDIYNLTYKVLSERFQYFLQDRKSVDGQKGFGIIVGDHRGSKDDKLLRSHHQMLIYSTGANTSRYENFIESIFLQPSHHSVGIQLADMVAGAVWRAYERKDSKYATQIKSTFRTHPATNKILGYGIVHVPKKGFRGGEDAE
jgi:hypothetical protein